MSPVYRSRNDQDQQKWEKDDKAVGLGSRKAKPVANESSEAFQCERDLVNERKFTTNVKYSGSAPAAKLFFAPTHEITKSAFSQEPKNGRFRKLKGGLIANLY